ncbi:MAG: ABC transporter ATP-binding protein [Minisyncoccia bacterium]
MNKIKSKNYNNPLNFFLTTNSKEIKWILLNSLFYGLGTITSIGISFYLGKIVDALNLDNGNIKLLIVLLVFVLFIHEIFYRIGHVLEVTVSARIRQSVKKYLFAHTSKLSFGYFADRFAGQISHKISTAADTLESMKNIVTNNFIDNTVLVVVSMITMALVYPPLGIAILVWVVIFVIGIRPFIRKINLYAEMFAEDSSNTTGALVDIYTNISSVKVYSRDFDQQRIYDQIDKEYNSQLAMGKWFVLVYLYQGISAILLGCAFIFFTVQGYAHGFISIGQIILVAGVGFKILDYVYNTGNSISEFTRQYSECSQVLKDLLLEPSVNDGKHHIPNEWDTVNIIYQDVSFTYNQNKKILDHFSLTIPVGQKIGIVGLSGVGKTTLINLLLRFFDPQEGKIIINNLDITEMTQESLRSHISFISQDTSLFHTTIAENIQYGSPEVSREKIQEVAKMAYADEFIQTLPNGYDTVVGERGVKLSGGQRQRVAIARAILKNSPLFILDEATSALDSDSEAKVQIALKVLMQNKTVIAIAHRLSTLQFMDRIIFLENGKIIEDGTHEELLKKNGKYANLWHMQAGGFLPEEV